MPDEPLDFLSLDGGGGVGGETSPPPNSALGRHSGEREKCVEKFVRNRCENISVNFSPRSILGWPDIINAQVLRNSLFLRKRAITSKTILGRRPGK